MRTTEQKRLRRRTAALKPFEEMYYEMQKMMSEMPIHKLKFLLESCNAMTRTNCSWASYQAAKHLKGEIGFVIGYKKTDKKVIKP